MTIPQFIGRVLIVLSIVVALIFLWVISDVLVLIFGAILLAVALRALADYLHDYTGVPTPLCLFAVIVLVFATGGIAVWFFGSRLSTEFARLVQIVPAGLQQLQHMLESTGWGKAILNQIHHVDLGAAGRGALSHVAGVFGSTMSLLADALAMIIAGLYLSYQPNLYRAGFLRLVPPRFRSRAEEILDALRTALRLWLLGQFLAMIAVGVLTAAALWLLGVPSAFALGLIAGLLEFIPFIGPVMAAVPGVLSALVVDPGSVLYVVLAYVVIQQTENHLLQPVIHREIVSLPPVLTVFSMITFGLIFGPFGVLLATPLTVVAMVAVEMLYVHDALGGPGFTLGKSGGADERRASEAAQ